MPRLLKGEYEAALKIAGRLNAKGLLASDIFRDEMDIWSGGELSMRQIDQLEDYAGRRVFLKPKQDLAAQIRALGADSLLPGWPF